MGTNSMVKETDFSTRLKQILTEKNMKQSDLLRSVNDMSDTTGIAFSQSVISQYIRGERIPKRDRLKIIASILNVNEYYLLGYNVARNSDIEYDEKRSINNVSTDKYVNTMNWLKREGWVIKHNSNDNTFSVRLKGWTYDRTLVVPEEELQVKIQLMIGFADYILRHPVLGISQELEEH